MRGAIYRCSAARKWYGTTKQGECMSKAEARAEGDRASRAKASSYSAERV